MLCFFILQSTGIGKSVNNLKKHGGNVAVLSKALVKKWKGLVQPTATKPNQDNSPCHETSQDSDVATKQQYASPRSLVQDLKKSSPSSNQVKSISSPVAAENYGENIKNKQKVRVNIGVNKV